MTTHYCISASPSYYQLGMCNQLNLVLNAIDQAIKVSCGGSGVVFKKRIKSAVYGGHLLTEYPADGQRL